MRHSSIFLEEEEGGGGSSKDEAQNIFKRKGHENKTKVAHFALLTP